MLKYNDITMSEVEDFIFGLEGNQREVLFFFHHFFTRELNLEAKIKFKIPFYYRKSWICFLNPLEGNKLELAFLRGNELSNAQGLLENKGRKLVYGIVIEKLTDAPLQQLHEIIHEAILLDANKPYSLKFKKKT